LRHRYLLPAIVLASACALACAPALAGASAAVRAAPQTAARAGSDTGPALWLPGAPAVGVSGGTSTVRSGGGTLQDTLVSLAIGDSSYQIPVDEPAASFHSPSVRRLSWPCFIPAISSRPSP